MSAPAEPPQMDARRRGRPASGGREAIIAATVALLREKGAARLTTREVAERAGVSEGSVFYHFHDRVGLLTAVSAYCIDKDAPSSNGSTDLERILIDNQQAIARLLETAMLAVTAVAADTELRPDFLSFLRAHDLGPHRGIEHLTNLLTEAQAAGSIRADADVHALATLVFGTAWLRESLIQGLGNEYVDEHLAAPQRLIAEVFRLARPDA